MSQHLTQTSISYNYSYHHVYIKPNSQLPSRVAKSQRTSANKATSHCPRSRQVIIGEDFFCFLEESERWGRSLAEREITFGASAKWDNASQVTSRDLTWLGTEFELTTRRQFIGITFSTFQLGQLPNLFTIHVLPLIDASKSWKMTTIVIEVHGSAQQTYASAGINKLSPISPPEKKSAIEDDSFSFVCLAFSESHKTARLFNFLRKPQIIKEAPASQTSTIFFNFDSG